MQLSLLFLDCAVITTMCCLHQPHLHYHHHHGGEKSQLYKSRWSQLLPIQSTFITALSFFKASFEGTQRTEHGSDVERHHSHHHHHHLHHHQGEQASKRREQHNFDVDRRHLRLFGRRASSYGHVRTPHHQLKVMMMMTMTKLMITIMSYGQKV